MDIPNQIKALAQSVGGNPISWREADDKIVIVFEDGRKLEFAQEKITEHITEYTPNEPAKPKRKAKPK